MRTVLFIKISVDIKNEVVMPAVLVTVTISPPAVDANGLQGFRIVRGARGMFHVERIIRKYPTDPQCSEIVSERSTFKGAVNALRKHVGEEAFKQAPFKTQKEA